MLDTGLGFTCAAVLDESPLYNLAWLPAAVPRPYLCGGLETGGGALAARDASSVTVMHLCCCIREYTYRGERGSIISKGPLLCRLQGYTLISSRVRPPLQADH